MSAEDPVPARDTAVMAVLAERRMTEEEHLKELEASLRWHPDHIAIHNTLVVLIASDQIEAAAVLRFPRSSLSINRNEHNNSIQLHFYTVLCVKHTILARLLTRGSV